MKCMEGPAWLCVVLTTTLAFGACGPETGSDTLPSATAASWADLVVSSGVFVGVVTAVSRADLRFDPTSGIGCTCEGGTVAVAEVIESRVDTLAAGDSITIVSSRRELIVARERYAISARRLDGLVFLDPDNGAAPLASNVVWEALMDVDPDAPGAPLWEDASSMNENSSRADFAALSLDDYRSGLENDDNCACLE